MCRIKIGAIFILLVSCYMITGCGRAEKVDINQSKEGEQGNVANEDCLRMEGEITVSSYFKDAYLDEAAKKFEKKYPKVKIKINTFTQPTEDIVLANGDSVAGGDDNPNKTMSNYITYLNTAFMSKEAEDIISLYRLPLYKYVESNNLLNIEPFIENSQFKDEDYYINILRLMKYKKGIYSIPTKYALTLAGINEEILQQAGIEEKALDNKVWNFDNMKNLGESIKNKTNSDLCINILGANGMFDEMFKMNLNYFLDVQNKKVNIDTKEYVEMLEGCKSLEDEGCFNNLAGDDRVLFWISDLMDQLAINDDYYITDDNRYVYFRPLANEVDKLNAVISNNYGINEDTKNAKLCWEFIKFMLSEEMQTSPNLGGLPVNKKAQQEYIKYWIKDRIQTFEEEGVEFTVTEEEVIKSYKNNIDYWANSISDYDGLDQTIYSEFQKENKLFFEGKKSAEEVAKTLQNKLYVMLNE